MPSLSANVSVSIHKCFIGSKHQNEYSLDQMSIKPLLEWWAKLQFYQFPSCKNSFKRCIFYIYFDTEVLSKISRCLHLSNLSCMVGQLEKSLDRRREAHWHGENCLSFFCEATVIITTKYQMRRADDSVFEYIWTQFCAEMQYVFGNNHFQIKPNLCKAINWNNLLGSSLG